MSGHLSATSALLSGAGAQLGNAATWPGSQFVSSRLPRMEGLQCPIPSISGKLPSEIPPVSVSHPLATDNFQGQALQGSTYLRPLEPEALSRLPSY